MGREDGYREIDRILEELVSDVSCSTKQTLARLKYLREELPIRIEGLLREELIALAREKGASIWAPTARDRDRRSPLPTIAWKAPMGISAVNDQTREKTNKVATTHSERMDSLERKEVKRGRTPHNQQPGSCGRIQQPALLRIRGMACSRPIVCETVRD